MAVAIKTKDNTLVVVDAVTSLREDYSASVTNATIEDGSSISDSVVMNNDTFSIEGVITSVGFLKKIGNSPFQESSSNLIESAVLNYNKPSYLYDILPSSVKNVVGHNNYPSVSVPSNVSLSVKQVKEQLIKIFKAGSLVTVQDSENSNKELTDYKVDCVITSVSFSEDASSEELRVSISFEQVRLVKLSKTNIGSIEWKSENITTQDSVSNGLAGSVQAGPQTAKKDNKYSDAQKVEARSKCLGRGNGAVWELTGMACILFGEEVPMDEVLKWSNE